MPDGSLVIRSAPSPLERLPGYLLRMAENNGYDDPRRILPLHRGRRRFKHLGTPPDADALATVLGVSVGTVQDLAYPSLKQSYLSFFGQKISVQRLSWRCPRICPHCLRNVQVISSLWDLPLVHACPFHACQLLRQCMACGTALTWKRAKIAYCGCGSDLREQATAPAPRAAIEVARRIAKTCGLMNAPPPTGFDTSALGLNDFLYVVEFLGRRSKRSFASGSFETRLSHNQLHDIAENGGRILEDPVAAICDIIAYTADIKNDVRIGKLIERYFFSMSKFSHPGAKTLLDEISASVRAAFDGRFSAKDLAALGATDKGPRTTHSRHRLTTVSGISKGRALVALERAGITFLESSLQTIAFSKSSLFGEEAQFREFCRQFSADLIPAKDAASRLGLPDAYSVPEFARRGLIDEIRVGSARLYSVASLDNLFSRLHERVCSSASLSDESIPSSLIDAIVAVLEGNCSLKRLSGGTGLSQFGIADRSGLVRLLNNDDGRVSVGAAAAFLQVSRSVVDSLLYEGLLLRRRALCAHTYGRKVSRAGSISMVSSVLCREDVERFSANYVLSRAVGAVLHCKHPAVGPALAKLGVLPATKCKHCGGHISIWSRTEVETAMGVPIPQAAWPESDRK